MRRTLAVFFFFNDPPPTEIYTLSLHDALPISWPAPTRTRPTRRDRARAGARPPARGLRHARGRRPRAGDRKSTRLNSSHVRISYAVFCLKKKLITLSRQITY